MRHGLGIGVGMALGLRREEQRSPLVYVMVGDAELDEGSNHEAIAFAGAIGLENLVTIVIDNQSSTHGWTGGDRIPVCRQCVDGRNSRWA